MQLVGLWMVVGVMVASALIFGWVAIRTHPLASVVSERGRQHRNEDLVCRACAQLDEEYRRLLQT